MRAVQSVEVKQRIPASRQAVWDTYTDHVSWQHWSRIGKVRLDREGRPSPNGTGCVRVISRGGVSAHEEILAFEPPRRMTYRVLKGGLPIRNHLGEVLLDEDGTDTLVTWRCRFESRVPGAGPLFRWIITRVFENTLTSLAAHRFPPA
jgi:uncharacterized protein YndB with AHSA1/START domain